MEVGLRMKMLESNRKEGNLWHGAPVWRTAWPSQAADLATWLQGTKTTLRSVRVFAPELLEINDAEHRIYLAFQGLPIHRRVENTFLDTLLPSDDQGIIEQSWQIGVDWPRPYQNYLECHDEPIFVPDIEGTLQAGSSLWFAQTSQPNVRIEVIGSSSPEPTEPSDGTAVATNVRLLLHETQGREIRTKISFFRDAVIAARVEISGKAMEELPIEKGLVLVDVKPNEISYIDVGFPG